MGFSIVESIVSKEDASTPKGTAFTKYVFRGKNEHGVPDTNDRRATVWGKDEINVGDKMYSKKGKPYNHPQHGTVTPTDWHKVPANLDGNVLYAELQTIKDTLAGLKVEE